MHPSIRFFNPLKFNMQFKLAIASVLLLFVTQTMAGIFCTLYFIVLRKSQN